MSQLEAFSAHLLRCHQGLVSARDNHAKATQLLTRCEQQYAAALAQIPDLIRHEGLRSDLMYRYGDYFFTIKSDTPFQEPEPKQYRVEFVHVTEIPPPTGLIE